MNSTFSTPLLINYHNQYQTPTVDARFLSGFNQFSIASKSSSIYRSIFPGIEKFMIPPVDNQKLRGYDLLSKLRKYKLRHGGLRKPGVLLTGGAIGWGFGKLFN